MATEHSIATSREEAKALGLTRYFTGTPCKRGHLADRYVIAARCVLCLADNARRYHAANVEKIRARVKRYTAAHPDANIKATRKYRQNNAEKVRAASRKWIRRNLPVPDREAPILCECCGRSSSGRTGTEVLCLDHDHVTRTFRGWLCRRCNRGIGILGDNLEGLMRAVAYLKRSENRA
jgi:Recombination endonuclease VII